MAETGAVHPEMFWRFAQEAGAVALLDFGQGRHLSAYLHADLRDLRQAQAVQPTLRAALAMEPGYAQD